MKSPVLHSVDEFKEWAGPYFSTYNLGFELKSATHYPCIVILSDVDNAPNRVNDVVYYSDFAEIYTRE